MRQTELVVYDALEACPYLPGRRARMPLRLPTRPLMAEEFDLRLDEGDRRYGMFLYRTCCPHCTACEPIRIAVADFQPTRRHRRILRRNDRLLQLRLARPAVDAPRLVLFNRHRRERGLSEREFDLDGGAYREFLVNSCCDTVELSYWRDDQLVAVAIVDRGRESWSAVYTYFSPDEQRLSLGVYSILKQIELCRQSHVRYLYLGLYVAECPRMVYKAEYLPHERLIGGRWRRFEPVEQ